MILGEQGRWCGSYGLREATVHGWFFRRCCSAAHYSKILPPDIAGLAYPDVETWDLLHPQAVQTREVWREKRADSMAAEIVVAAKAGTLFFSVVIRDQQFEKGTSNI